MAGPKSGRKNAEGERQQMTETEKIAHRVYERHANAGSEEPYSSKRPRVVVVIEDGLVTDILANGDGIEVAVIDYDIDPETEDQEVMQIPQAGNQTAPAFASVRSVDTVPDRVAQLFAAIEGGK